MRKQMFLKSYLMKIAFLLVFLTGAVPTYSAVLLVDHQLDTPLLQELDISGQDKKKGGSVNGLCPKSDGRFQ